VRVSPQPRFSKPAHCLSVNLPDREAGFEPATYRVKARRSAVALLPTNWWRVMESNHLIGLLLNLGYSQTPRHTGLPRLNGGHGRSRTCTDGVLSAVTLPVGLRARNGGVGAIRTRTRQALNLLTLPIGLRRREWWACPDSNRDCSAFETVASAGWTTGPREWRKGQGSNLSVIADASFRDSWHAIVPSLPKPNDERKTVDRRRVRTTAGSGNSSVKIGREVVSSARQASYHGIER
jgi:hypothetical protein